MIFLLGKDAFKIYADYIILVVSYQFQNKILVKNHIGTSLNATIV